MSKRVGFFPEVNEKQLTFLHKPGGGAKVGATRKRVVIRIWTLRLPRSSGFSPVRFLKLIGAKVARALRLVSTRKRSSSSRKVSSSCLTRSRSYADQIDSHRAQAVEDCIEFLNSSSSSSFLQRSSSVSSTSC